MKLISRTKKDKKGFTLIEFIVVIALLAIIMLLAIPQYNQVREESAEKVAIANARACYTAGMAADALASTPAEITTLFNKFTEDIEGTATWDTATDQATWAGSIDGKAKSVKYPPDPTP